MARPRSIHELIPTTMVSALLAGLLFAAGHHLFYASLEQHTVPTGSYVFAGRSFSKQQFNFSVGIAFAYLVKTFLCFAVSIAYIQVFWRSTLGPNSKQSPTLNELDWAYSGGSNMFHLFNLKLIFKYPDLVLLAIIFWCIPIATLFPPATLSVENANTTPSLMLQVPQLDFANLNYVAPIQKSGDDSYPWNGANDLLRRIALTVMSRGERLSTIPPAPNANWTLEFWGPALQCNDVEATQRDRTWTNFWNSYGNCRKPTPYTSWVPWSVGDPTIDPYNFTVLGIDRDLPFILNLSISESSTHFESVDIPCAGPTSSTISTNGPLSLFVGVVPRWERITLHENRNLTTASASISEPVKCKHLALHSISDNLTIDCDPSGGQISPATMFVDSSLLRCDLVNISYSVAFDFVNGTGDVRISTDNSSTSPPVNGSRMFLGPNDPGLTGDQRNSTPSCMGVSAFEQPLENGMGGPCAPGVEALRVLSYQAIMEVFNQVVVGTVNSDNGTWNSMIVNSVLTETSELAFIQELQDRRSNGSAAKSIQRMLSDLGLSRGLMNSKPPGIRGDLKQTLEQLFQNITISLLSDPHFHPNYSSEFAPQRLINVTLPMTQTIYTYDRATLWIAYGLAITATLLAAAGGITTLFLTGSSYSAKFSTLIRVGRHADLSIEVSDADGSGADPLPSYLKYARLDVFRGTAAMEKSETASVGMGIPLEEQALVPQPDHSGEDHSGDNHSGDDHSDEDHSDEDNSSVVSPLGEEVVQ